jgi:hypothetical protein
MVMRDSGKQGVVKKCTPNSDCDKPSEEMRLHMKLHTKSHLMPVLSTNPIDYYDDNDQI